MTYRTAVMVLVLGLLPPAGPPPDRACESTHHAIAGPRIKQEGLALPALRPAPPGAEAEHPPKARADRSSPRTSAVRPAPPTTVKAARAPVASKLPTPPASTAGVRVSATAYCLTSNMANGRPAADGYVAGRTRAEAKPGAYWPLGARLYVVELGRTFTVGDRIGAHSDLDVAMPGRCAAAKAFGRRTLTVRRVA